MKSSLYALFLAGLLAGCATPNTGHTVIDEGPQPTLEAANAAILNYLKTNLKDPDSLKQFEIYTTPAVVSWYRGLINGGGHEKAWLYCFQYNAKNSYGGYVGLKKDGLGLRMYTGSTEVYVIPDINWAIASTRCW